MSSRSSSSPMTSVPRWKTILEKALSDYPSQNVFSLASIEIHGGSIVPRVRSHIHRDFMNSASKPQFPMLLTTTDIRSAKIGQFLRHNIVEQVWWFAGAKQQFRITSQVYVLPQTKHQLYNQFLQSLGGIKDPEDCGMGVFKGLTEEEWEEKRLAVFEAMEPNLKATWARPEAPGSLMGLESVPGRGGGASEAISSISAKWPPKVDASDNHGSADDNWHQALHNFAVVILDPISVDLVDMSIRPNRRFSFQKKEGGWSEEELVP